MWHAAQVQAGMTALYGQAGLAALEGQSGLARRVAGQLDALLQERIDDMWLSMALRTAVIAVLVLVFLYFGIAFYFVNRGGTHIIQQHRTRMAQGDLQEAPPKPWGRDEPAQIIANLRVTYDSLPTLIRKVRHAARDLASASEEIAHASRDLGVRTEAAATHLEQQASAMKQIGSQADATAQRARETAQFSQTNARGGR